MSKARIWAAPFIFVLILVVLHVVLRQSFLSVLISTSPAFMRDRELNEQKEPFDVVIIGDSHAMLLDPEALGNAANQSELGAGYMLMYYNLARHLKQRPNLCRAVLVPTDLHSFTMEWGRFTADKRRALYVDHLELARRDGESLRHGAEFLQHNVFPYASLPKTLGDSILPSKRDANLARMQEKLHSSFSERSEEELRLAAEWIRGAHYRSESWFDDGQAEYFNRILDLCEQHGVRVILVRYPVSDFYLETSSQCFPLEEHAAKVQELLASRAAPLVLDYQTVFAARRDLFSDSDHLNADGIETFTALLRDDLIRHGILLPKETR